MRGSVRVRPSGRPAGWRRQVAIYEMEPPPEWASQADDGALDRPVIEIRPLQRRWRDPLTEKDEARIRRHTENSCAWLFAIAAAWVVTYDWALVARTFSSPKFWSNIAIELLLIL
jgi:hypothetical protein